MCRLIAFTNRRLCPGDFLTQIKILCDGGVDAVILREKDLPQRDYRVLAEKVMSVCADYSTLCVLHNDMKTAEAVGASAIHLPMAEAEKAAGRWRDVFPIRGISCHSLDEAERAVDIGATYITASHIFTTDCKKGVSPRGLDFLREICENIDVPVYALGGISVENARSCIDAGAAGVCAMSAMMKADGDGLAAWRKALQK